MSEKTGYCGHCKRKTTASDYYKKRNASWCKKCCQTQIRKWQKKHRKKFLESCRTYMRKRHQKTKAIRDNNRLADWLTMISKITTPSTAMALPMNKYKDYFIIDKADLQLISLWFDLTRPFTKWTSAQNPNISYPVQNIINSKTGYRNITIPVHRVLLGCLNHNSLLVDHINGNGCDNRRENLQLVTHQANMRNRHRHKQKTSCPYIGVFFLKDPSHAKKPWIAKCMIDGSEQKYLGCYTTAKEAAVVYDDYLRTHTTSVARFNYPRKGEQQA